LKGFIGGGGAPLAEKRKGPHEEDSITRAGGYFNSEEGAGLSFFAERKRYEKMMCPTKRGHKSKSDVMRTAIAKDEP
jgi:hypothetical protein